MTIAHGSQDKYGRNCSNLESDDSDEMVLLTDCAVAVLAETEVWSTTVGVVYAGSWSKRDIDELLGERTTTRVGEAPGGSVAGVNSRCRNSCNMNETGDC